MLQQTNKLIVCCWCKLRPAMLNVSELNFLLFKHLIFFLTLQLIHTVHVVFLCLEGLQIIVFVSDNE